MCGRMVARTRLRSVTKSSGSLEQKSSPGEAETARLKLGLDLDDWHVPFWLAEQKVLAEQPPLAKAGVTLEQAENLRAYAWAQPFVECEHDWDAVKGRIPHVLLAPAGIKSLGCKRS